MSNTVDSAAVTIRQLLASVLYVDPTEVPDDATFVGLGLDSIIAVEFVANLRNAFPLAITVDEVYESATVPALAARLIGKGA